MRTHVIGPAVNEVRLSSLRHDISFIYNINNDLNWEMFFWIWEFLGIITAGFGPNVVLFAVLDRFLARWQNCGPSFICLSLRK